MKTGYSRMHDVSMMKDRSYLSKLAACVHDRLSKINYNKINKGESMLTNLQ
jgi:hypothetical protein